MYFNGTHQNCLLPECPHDINDIIKVMGWTQVKGHAATAMESCELNDLNYHSMPVIGPATPNTVADPGLS